MKLRLPKLLKAALLLACVTASLAFTLGTASAADRTTAATTGVWNAALFGGFWADGDAAIFTSTTGGSFTLSGNIVAASTAFKGRAAGAEDALKLIPWTFDLKGFTLNFGVVTMPNGGRENSPITIKGGVATMTSYQANDAGGGHQTWFTIETGASLVITGNAQSGWLNKKGAGTLKIGGNMIFDKLDNQFLIGGGSVELVGNIVDGKTGDFASITGGSALILHSGFSVAGAERNIIFNDAVTGNMLKLDSRGGLTPAGMTIFGSVSAADAADKNGIIVNVAGDNRITGGFRFGATEANGSVQVEAGTLTIDGDITATGAFGFHANVSQGASLVVNNIVVATGKLNAAKKFGVGTMTLKGAYATPDAGVFDVAEGKLIIEGKGSLALAGKGTNIAVSGTAAEFNVRNAVTLDTVTNNGIISVSHQGLLTINGNTRFTASTKSQIGVIGGGTLKLVSSGTTLAYAGGMTISGNSTESNPLFIFDLSKHTLTTPLLTLAGALTWTLADTQYIELNFGTVTPTAGAIYTLISAASLAGTMQDYIATGNGFIYTYKLENNALKVVVSEANRRLTWTGGSGTWQLGMPGEGMWDNDNGEGFLLGDAVVFNGAGGTINLLGSLRPSSVLVDATSDYTFSGLGQIKGAIDLTKSGSGTLTINTVNTFSGTVRLNGGTLIVGNASALGTGEGGIVGGGTATLDLRQVVGEFSTSSVNTTQAATLTILGNLKVSNFTGEFNKGGGTVNLASGTNLTLSAAFNPKVPKETIVTLNNLSGSGTIIYSAGSTTLNNSLTLVNVSSEIDIQLVSGRLGDYRGDSITLNSNSTAANASLSYVTEGATQRIVSTNITIGSGGGAIYIDQNLLVTGDITAVEGSSGNLELTVLKNATFSGTVNIGGALKVLGGQSGTLTLKANDTGSNSFEMGSLNLDASGRLVIDSDNVTIRGWITMAKDSSIMARGGVHVFDSNVRIATADNNHYSMGGTGLSFNKLQVADGGANSTFVNLDVSGNVSFRSTDIGGYGFIANVAAGYTLNLGSVSFANNAVGFRKEGAGTMVITNITTAVTKPLLIRGGVVDFNLAAGIVVDYTNVISSDAGTATGTVKKSGDGTLVLSGTNTFEGGVILTGGTLCASDNALGVLAFRDITMTGNAVLQSSATGGAMRLNSLSIGDRSTLDFGGAGNTQTITAGSVALGEGAVLRLNLKDAADYDQLIVTENLAFMGQGTLIQLDLASTVALNGNPYILIDASKATIDDLWEDLAIDQNSLNRGITATGEWERQLYKVWLTGNAIEATVVWNGGVSADHRWIAGGTGWTGTNEKNFKNGDSVVFSATPEGGEGLVGNVTLIGSLNPKSILVTGGRYNFMGDGTIIGTGSLTLQGDSQLTINMANTYSGGTILEGAAFLVLGAEGALGSGLLTVKGNNTTLNTTSLVSGYTHSGGFDLNEGGTLTVTGDLTLKGMKSLGTLNVNGGLLKVTGAFTGGATSVFRLVNEGELSFNVLAESDVFATKVSSDGATRVTYNYGASGNNYTLQTNFTGFSGVIQFNSPSSVAFFQASGVTFNSFNNANITLDITGGMCFQENNASVNGVVRNMNFLFRGTSADNSVANIGNLQIYQDNLVYAGTMTVAGGASARIGSNNQNKTTTITGNLLGEGTLQLGRAGLSVIHTFLLSGNNTIAKLILGGGTKLGADAGASVAHAYAKSANALGKHVVFSNNNSEIFVDFSKVTVGDISSFATVSNKITIMGHNIFEVNTSVATSVFHGVIKDGAIAGDAGILQKSGTGTLTLAGANTYSGGTIISAGTLILTGAGTLGSGDVKLEGSSVSNAVTLNLNSSTAISNKIIISDGKFGKITGWNQASKAQIGLGSGATYVGDLSLGATQRLNILGARAGVATVSGNLTLNSSILNFSLGTSEWNSLTVSGSFVVNEKSAINIDLGSSSLSKGTYLLVSTSGVLSPDFVTSKFDLTGVVSTGRRGYALAVGNGTAGSTSNIYLSVIGGEAKNLTWNGSAGNMTWNGLEANKNWLDVSSAENDKSQFYMDGDTLEFTVTGAGTVQIAELGVTPKAMTISGGDYTFTGGAIKGGTLNVTSGSVVLANNNTSLGALSIDAGGFTAQLGNGEATGDWKGSITIGDQSSLITNRSDAALTLIQLIAGAGKFVQRGTGTVTIHSDILVDGNSSKASFAGGTTVEKGFLTLGTGKAVASKTFRFGSGDITLLDTAQVNLQLTSGGALNGYTFTNNWVVTGNATIAYRAGGDRNTLSGTISIANDKTLTLASNHLNGAAGANVVSGIISGAGSLALTGGTTTSEGVRRVELAGENTFTGAISVTNNNFTGTLELVLTNANAASKASGIALSSTELQHAKLVLGVDTLTLKGLTSADQWSSLGTKDDTTLHTLTLDMASNGTFAGQISGNLAINKTGTGIWTLSGANSYTGGTTIAGGTISVVHLDALGKAGLVNLTGGGLSIDVASFARDLTVSSGDNTLTGTGAASYAGIITLSSVGGTSSLSLDGKAFSSTINSTGGTNTLNGAGAFTGNLSVSAGSLVLGSVLGVGNAIALSGGATLNVNSQAVSRDLVVSGSGTLSGNNSYTGSITLGDAANLTVVSLGLVSGQNLNLGKDSKITGGLALNGGSLLFDLDTNDPTSWDSLTLSGDLTGSSFSATSFKLTFTGGIAEGDSYLLMTYGGMALTSEVLNQLQVSLNVGRTTVLLIGGSANGANTITAQIGNTDFLIWRGKSGTGANIWQTQDTAISLDANAPWLVNGESDIIDNHFHATDAVVFKGDGAGVVNISGLVLPSTITVSSGSYQFVNVDANSGLAGSGSLAVSGDANLSINSANAQWTGPILLNGGTLILGVTGAFGSGVLTYNSGSLGIAKEASHSLTDGNFKLAKTTTEMSISVDGSLTISGAMTGLKTLNVAGTAGTISLAAQAGSFSINVVKNAMLSLQDAAAHTGVTNIAGALSTTGNVGGTLNLNEGGKLNLASGEMSNVINVAGASTLNREAGTWKQLNLKQGSSLTYQVNGAAANLLVAVAQSLTANFGSQLNGVLDLSGGILKIGQEGMTTATDQTVLTLNGGQLITTSRSVVDMSDLSLTKKGVYTFTLVENANTLFNLDLLSLTYQGAGMNLVGAPVLAKENGALVLKFEVAASLTWNGSDLSDTWTTDQTVTNWLKEGDGGQAVASAFGNNDFVVFNDDAAWTTVQVVGEMSIGTLRPISMVVSGRKSYTFEGAGNIIATGLLNYSSTGDLIFKNEGVNEFLSGIQVALGAGTLTLQGGSSLKGDLTLGSKLSIESSAVSQFTNVAGAGNITIKGTGTGGASLSSNVVGAYTGSVTIHQGILKNSNALGMQKLAIEASGDVQLTGVNASHLSSLNTSVAGAQITGLTGTVTLTGGKFSLSTETSDRAVVIFTNGSGSLNFSSLELDLKGGIVFLDDTLTHDFVLTNGILGSALHQMDHMGKYRNITFTPYLGDPDTYAVMSINGGTITIGGTKAYENFVLDVNNQWTPHIASTESANFTAAQFKTFGGEDFASVTIDGRLGLTGEDDFLLNHLSGGSTGKIFVTDGAAITLDAAGEHPLNQENVYKGVFSAGKSDVTVTTDADTSQSLLGSNNMLTLTLSADSNLILGGFTKIEGKEVAGVDGTITRQALTLGSGSSLTFAEGSFTEVGGNVILEDQAHLTGSGILSILAGNSLSLGVGAVVDGTLVINLEADSGDTGSLDVGTARITLGGITGGGYVKANTGSLITLNVTGEEVFTGTLSGSGTEAAPETGSIVKTGAGNQVLAGKTDKFNLYDLTVNEGTLTLRGAEADYNDLVVGATGGATKVRAAVPKGYMNVENKITAKSLIVNENGVLTIGSASGNKGSMIVEGLASFITGSEMVVYVNTDNTPLISANEITGLANISQVTLNASAYWQANLNVILFQSEEELQDRLNADNVILSGFGDKNIIYSDDNKTVTISAYRGFDDNPYKNAMAGASQNANAGMDIIWDANVRAGENGGNIAADSNLAAIFNSMVFLGSGSEASNRLMSAVAGSSVTALAGSQRDDFRQQQDWIRNRTTGMGISPDYVHEDLPYVNGWIQANGGTTRVSQDGDEAGYNLDTFGGTFGFDVDLSPKTTWGFAFTANYNKLTASASETARGHNDAYYANLFLRTQNKRWANTFILTGGWNDASLDRTVTGPFVNYTAKGSTSGATIGAMYETTYDYVLNENKTRIFQPLLNLSFANSSMDAYTEEGAGNAGLKVEETKGTYGTIALGARLLGTVGQSFFGRTALGELRLQVSQDIGDDSNTAKVGLGGIQREVLGTKVGKTAIQFGAGISIPVSEEGGSVYFDVNTDFRSNATNVNGNIGYRVNF